jgi:hypothetical protein
MSPMGASHHVTAPPGGFFNTYNFFICACCQRHALTVAANYRWNILRYGPVTQSCLSTESWEDSMYVPRERQCTSFVLLTSLALCSRGTHTVTARGSTTENFQRMIERERR